MPVRQYIGRREGGARRKERRGQGEAGKRGEDRGRQEGDLREGEGHQSTTNHYKVKDVP